MPNLKNATILFMDVEEFSKRGDLLQEELIGEMTRIVLEHVGDLLKDTRTPDAIALPTGDGMAIAFFHHTKAKWKIQTIIKLILALIDWGKNHTFEVRCRFGIHFGPVLVIKDVTNRQNICGNTINHAQRVMDAANPNQILFSKEAVEHYTGKEKYVSGGIEYNNEKFVFEGPHGVFVKHDIHIVVFILKHTKTRGSLSTQKPISKLIVLPNLVQLPKSMNGDFAKRLREAKNIAFIMLTGDSFLKNYEEGKIKLSNNLESFKVFMPDPVIHGKPKSQHTDVKTSFLRKCVSNWKQFLKELKKDSKYKNTVFKLGIFKETPYFGASFFDWNAPEGIISISPYVWKKEVQQCPAYEIRWLGENPPEIYDVYRHGLNYIDTTTENFLNQKPKA